MEILSQRSRGVQPHNSFHMSTQGWPGTSLHVISFTRPFPALVLQVTNNEVRRPGYEASTNAYQRAMRELFCPKSQWPSFPSPSVSVTQVWSHCWTYLLEEGNGRGQDNRYTQWQ